LASPDLVLGQFWFRFREYWVLSAAHSIPDFESVKVIQKR